jgi:hypothetical protein
MAVLTFIFCGVTMQEPTVIAIADNIFDGNIAGGSGGGLVVSGISGIPSSGIPVNIVRNVFRHNKVLYTSLWSLSNLVCLWH